MNVLHFFFNVNTQYHFLLVEISRYIQFTCFIEHYIPKILNIFLLIKRHIIRIRIHITR